MNQPPVLPTVPAADAARPWLSVLLPVYNVAPYLQACLDSVLGQWMDGIEVLALDDCSTDGSRAILDDCARGRPQQLRVAAHERNAGLSAARNTLLSQARGTYVWFLDSDDLLADGAVAELHAIVQRHAPDMVLCDFSLLRERMGLKHRLRGELHRRTYAGTSGVLLEDRDRLVRGLFAAGQMHAWSKIFRRDIWPAGPLFAPGRYFEDAHAIPQLALHARTHFHACRPWVVYRQRAGSILRTMDARKTLDLATAFEDFAAAAHAAGLRTRPDTDFAIAHQCAKNYIGACRHAAPLPGAGFPALHARFTAAFLRSSPLGPRQLIGRYLARLWWWRSMRLLAWLRSPAEGPGMLRQKLF